MVTKTTTTARSMPEYVDQICTIQSKLVDGCPPLDNPIEWAGQPVWPVEVGGTRAFDGIGPGKCALSRASLEWILSACFNGTMLN